MSGLEFNKFAAGVLIAGLATIGIGKVAGILYQPETEPKVRGYQVAVAESSGAGTAAKAEEKPEDVLALIATADIAKGEKLKKKCISCHSFEQGGPTKVGPNLWNILGKDIASGGGFAYSDALSGMEGNWDYVGMSEFLKSPKKYAPGTKMSFAGIRSVKDRANMLAYLRSLSNAPIALPDVPEPVAGEETEPQDVPEEKPSPEAPEQ